MRRSFQYKNGLRNDIHYHRVRCNHRYHILHVHNGNDVQHGYFIQLAKKMNEIDNAMLKTGIEIVNVSATNKSELSEINVSIDNTGTTKILNSDFKHIDVFIHYNAAGAGNITKWIQYNGTECGALQNNEWTVRDISPDLANPRIFDPDEEMEICIQVYPAIEENSTNWVNVVTPNGVSASRYFQY